MEDDEKVVLPTNDLKFKKILASPENKDILIGFINDFYDLKIVDVYIENPYAVEEFSAQSKGYFITEINAVCTDSNDLKYIVEIQLQKTEYHDERSLLYIFDKYTSCYGNEELMKEPASKYSSLCPLYSIKVLDFIKFDDRAAVHKFSFYDAENETKLLPTDNVTVGYFEVVKNPLGLSENLKYWKEFFTKGYVPIGSPEYIKKAGTIIKKNFSAEEYSMIDRIERLREDIIARELYVENEGFKRGQARGKEDGKAEVAANLLRLKQTSEFISQVTGMSLDEILDLRIKMKRKQI